MKLFLDENFPGVPAGQLLEQFPDSIYAATDNRFQGKPDSTIFRFLARNPFVLITLDKDFANLVEYPPTATAGIIVVREGDMNVSVTMKRLSLFLASVNRTVRASRLTITR